MSREPGAGRGEAGRGEAGRGEAGRRRARSAKNEWTAPAARPVYFKRAAHDNGLGHAPGEESVRSESAEGAPIMIVATEIELRAGARLLLEGASFQVAPGDRIGLVGRNGAGKTTLAKVLAGQAQPAAGVVRRSGPVDRKSVV